MNARLALIASMLALAACQPPATTGAVTDTPATPPAENADATPVSTEGCATSTERLWGPIGPSDHPSYRVKAWTSGPGCDAAVVTLAIYARDGYPIYAWAGATQYLFLLNDKKDQAGMQEGLNEWIGPDNLPPEMTGTLPPWEETEGQPKRAEFPFMPTAGMDQATYDDLRKQNLHMLCYPQGMESQLCLALHPSDGNAPAMIEEIGLQLFPG